MKVITLKTLKQDEQRFFEILEEEKLILEKAQSAILRIDGVLIYIGKNIKELEGVEDIKEGGEIKEKTPPE